MALAALAALLPVQALAANPEVELSLSFPEEAGVGESFEVELLVSGNPGACAAQFTLAFDSEVLDCTSCRLGPVLSGMMGAANPDASDGAIVAGASALPVEGDGVLAVFRFTVLAGEGDYGFALRDVVLADEDNQPLPYTLTIQGQPAPSGGGQPTEDGEDDPPPATEADPPATESDPPATEADPPAAEADPPAAEAPGAGELTDPARTLRFTDAAGHWAEDYINQAAALGLVEGYGGGLYGPEDGMTRAQFFTILWRGAGEPEPAGPSSFTDLGPAQSWYYKAVAWAEETGVTDGVGGGRFAPGDAMTREQIATTLYRLSGGVPGEEQGYYGIYAQAFTDSAEVSGWAVDAVWWAVYHSLWSGVGSVEAGQDLSPGAPATRGQIAVVMARYHEF